MNEILIEAKTGRNDYLITYGKDNILSMLPVPKPAMTLLEAFRVFMLGNGFWIMVGIIVAIVTIYSI